ncbi:MAG: RluA family pseudouridine synthase [Polyangiaceae bacterium]|nr:RluA family pseudouridine synthase [Polyangiaceae bacterium]
MTVTSRVVVRNRTDPRSRCWFVRAGDGRTLAGVLERLGEAHAAVREGRVFVNGRRARDPRGAVGVGDRVEVSSRSPAFESIRLVERRGGIAVVYKPPGIATEPDRSGRDASVVAQAARLLDPGRGSVHACSRLDLGVSGLVLVTTSSEARSHIEALRRDRGLSKVYLAIASGAPDVDRGSWTWDLERRGRLRRAITDFEVLCRAPESTAASGTGRRIVRPTLLRLVAQTGRWHQLRLHAARAGLALIGDRRHGGPERLCSQDGAVHLAPRVALDAARLELCDERGQPWVVQAPCPGDLRGLWLGLGGPAGALDAWLRPVDGTSFEP